MATTINRANLTVRITENITINNRDRGSEHTVVISNINQVDNRVVTLASGSTTTLLTFGGTSESDEVVGTLINSSSFKYVRITNKDASNFVRLNLSSSKKLSSDMKLPAGGSFTIFSNNITGSDHQGSDAIYSYKGAKMDDFNDLKYVTAEPSGSHIDIEVFYALSGSG